MLGDPKVLHRPILCYDARASGTLGCSRMGFFADKAAYGRPGRLDS